MAHDPLFSVEGLTVLVTGASSGLGAHFSELLAARGARVVMAARRLDRLAEIRGQIASSGGVTPLTLELDVADEDSVAAAFRALERQGVVLDVLVNNAGVAESASALDMSLEAFDRIMAVNLRGVWLMATEAARRWWQAGRPGAVVNIASILGERVAGAVAPYAASKAAVVQLTRALALEWARHGIRVNAIAPGYIATEINEGFMATPAGEALVKRIPMRRIGETTELDGPLLLLCSKASSFMTGSLLVADGGHLVSSL